MLQQKVRKKPPTGHNLKVAGSNPAPATRSYRLVTDLKGALRGAFGVGSAYVNTMSTNPMRRMTPNGVLPLCRQSRRV
jgi:hypothetical protein